MPAKRALGVLMVMMLAFALATSTALAKGPGGGGGGGGGGSGTEFADLLILYRDLDGVPITTDEFVGEHGSEYCVQPVTSQLVPNPYYLINGALPQYLQTTINAVSGQVVTLVPLFAHFPEFLPPEAEDIDALQVEPMAKGGGKPAPTEPPEEEEGGEPCDPLVITLPDGTAYNYGQFASEVELERLNLARAPERVLRQQMDELALLLQTTDPMNVTLDAAGRITFDGVAVDAMPKLQGMRESLFETATIPGATAYLIPFQLVNPDFATWDAWELSALALGGAASKFGTVGIDAVLYHDRIMGIPTSLSPLMGTTNVSTELGESFVDYGTFSYARSASFRGCVTYLDPLNWQLGYQVKPWSDVVAFNDLTPGGGNAANVAGYAQMAEDARAVILFIHEVDATIAYADPIGLETCAAQQILADDLNDVAAETGLMSTLDAIASGSDPATISDAVSKAVGKWMYRNGYSD